MDEMDEIKKILNKIIDKEKKTFAIEFVHDCFYELFRELRNLENTREMIKGARRLMEKVENKLKSTLHNT